MISKLVTQLDDAGYFRGFAVADESPLEPGKFLLPANCVDVEPPEVPTGFNCKFVNGSFELEPVAEPVAVEVEPTKPLPEVETSPLNFMERFTPTEQLTIVSAALQNPMLYLWLLKLTSAQTTVFADPRLSAGLDALVEAGLITAERSAEILPLSVRSSGLSQL